jgi:hypothetical protein
VKRPNPDTVRPAALNGTARGRRPARPGPAAIATRARRQDAQRPGGSGPRAGDDHRIPPLRDEPAGRGSSRSRSARIPDRSPPRGTSPSPSCASGHARTQPGHRDYGVRAADQRAAACLPGPGDARSRRPVRLGLLQPGSCVLCGRRPQQGGSGAADARFPRRHRPGTACHLRAQRPVGLHHTRRCWQGRVGLVRPADTVVPSPVPEQARPRPVPEPGSPAEPARVNHRSPPAVDGTPGTGLRPLIHRSRVDNYPMPVQSRSFPDLPQPAESPAFALVIGAQGCRGPLRASHRHPGHLHGSSTSLRITPTQPTPPGP